MDQGFCVLKYAVMPVVVVLPLWVVVFISLLFALLVRWVRQLQGSLTQEKAKSRQYEEQIAHRSKDQQDSRANLASPEELQPVGEDQTGVSTIHASPVATEGEQPRIRSGTLGMEKEFPSSESEATAREMLVAAMPSVKQQAAQGSKEGKRQSDRDKRKCEEAEARSRQSQLEIANLKEEIAELKQDRIAQSHQDEQLEQVSRAKEASSEQVQPGGEDQTGVPVIHDSSPVVTEGEQPRLQSGTLGMEKEFPSSESEATASEMLVAAMPSVEQQAAQGSKEGKRRRNRVKKKPTLGMEKEVPSSEAEATTSEKLVEACLKPNNSEGENMAVDEGLKKKLQPFARKSSFSSGASLPLADLSGVVADGRQPLSSAKDATITTQIDKKINKVPTGIESKDLSKHDLDLRQLLSDANSGQIIDQLDMKINPNLDETALSGGRLSKSKFPFQIMLRALLMIILEKPNKSDIDNPKWLDRHHLKKFKEESGGDWLKENLEPRKAEERLNILEKAAVASLGKAGRQLVLLYKTCAQTNHQLHPKIDLDEVISYSKERTYTSDGEDLGEVVRLLAGELKKQS